MKLTCVEPKSVIPVGVKSNDGKSGSGSHSNQEFQLIYREGKKNDNMRFSSEWRSTILTEIWSLLQNNTNNDSADAIQATKVNKIKTN